MEEKKYSAAEVERTLKIQEVIAKAMAKKLTWWEAAEIMGVTDRTMRRWRERIEKGGYTSLYDRRRHPSPKRIALELSVARHVSRWDIRRNNVQAARYPEYAGPKCALDALFL